MAFTGFPSSGFAFLRQLKANNDRDWFRERKAEYESKVEGPMRELVLAISAECDRQKLPLRAKDRSPVMRVYRDIRFSKDKRPFKSHVGAELRSTEGDGLVGLYLHFAPEESFIATGVYQPERPVLLAWREELAENPARFEKLVATLAKAKLEFSREESLTKFPRGFSQHESKKWAHWLKLTSFVTSLPVTQKEVSEPRFVQAAIEFAKVTQPLRDYAVEVAKKAKPVRKKIREEEFV